MGDARVCHRKCAEDVARVDRFCSCWFCEVGWIGHVCRVRMLAYISFKDITFARRIGEVELVCPIESDEDTLV